MRDIGKNIRDIRALKNMTQEVNKRLRLPLDFLLALVAHQPRGKGDIFCYRILRKEVELLKHQPEM